MTLGKKNSRTISVDGCVFRWTVFQNSGWNDLTIQSDEGTGRKLIVQFTWEVKDGSSLPNQPITPAVVAEAIHFALKNDWDPSVNGAPFGCRFENGTFTAKASPGKSTS